MLSNNAGRLPKTVIDTIYSTVYTQILLRCLPYCVAVNPENEMIGRQEPCMKLNRHEIPGDRR